MTLFKLIKYTLITFSTLIIFLLTLALSCSLAIWLGFNTGDWVEMFTAWLCVFISVGVTHTLVKRLIVFIET